MDISEVWTQVSTFAEMGKTPLSSQSRDGVLSVSWRLSVMRLSPNLAYSPAPVWHHYINYLLIKHQFLKDICKIRLDAIGPRIFVSQLSAHAIKWILELEI